MNGGERRYLPDQDLSCRFCSFSPHFRPFWEVSAINGGKKDTQICWNGSGKTPSLIFSFPFPFFTFPSLAHLCPRVQMFHVQNGLQRERLNNCFLVFKVVLHVLVAILENTIDRIAAWFSSKNLDSQLLNHVPVSKMSSKGLPFFSPNMIYCANKICLSTDLYRICSYTNATQKLLVRNKLQLQPDTQYSQLSSIYIRNPKCHSILHLDFAQIPNS